MTSPAAEAPSHIYHRTVDTQERSSLSVLASLIPHQALVLDLGCGSGALGNYLQQQQACTCDGLTWSQEEAALAAPHYRQLEVADLEQCDLLATFPQQHYDRIVCADVLEHLRQPERVLAACRQLLKPNGQLLISIPNASYAGLVAELLHGEFRYRPEGLLDNTHLRFFTRRSLLRFLAEQQWQVLALDSIQRPLHASEFSHPFDSLPPAVARYLLAGEDALSYQFILQAQPTATTPDNAHSLRAWQHSATTPQPAQALFTAEVYTDYGQGYKEAHKHTATGIIGQERQTLTFTLPAPQANTSPLQALRIDPADRPGFLYLHALRLRDSQGQLILQWQAQAPEQRYAITQGRHQHILWHSPMPTSSALSLLLTGDDPWFELALPPELASTPQQLEVDLGWPMSADYLALSSALFPLQEQALQLPPTQQQLADTQAANADLQREQAHLQQEKEQLQQQIISLQTQQLEQHQQMQAQLQTQQQNLQALQQHLQGIENSTVFRATRPLVHAKMRIDRLLGRKPKHERNAASSHNPQPLLPSGPVQPMPAPDWPVDIIVPVYRGLADTQLCINSVLAAPVQCAWRLIVINDCSPEPEVTDWLRERASQDSRMVLLENDSNLGFVGTVNRGMAYSDSHDVLLLNSDTEVANNWLDRIRAAAYGDTRIASVTPFSTNATICSYPRFCEDNPLPPGQTTASLDALCAQTNPGLVVDVPTGVGFCMYIRRDCLQAVGLFDVESFGKGYGEENDFCQRAARQGWRNLHLLDTFVLHTGGVSFGASKSPREQAAMETIRRLHPQYEQEVHTFVQADPARTARLALDIARITSSGLPVILAIMHNREGGTLRHVRELAAHLQGQATVLTLTPGADASVLLGLASAAESFTLQFRLADQWPQLLDMLRQLGVCHLHYHHLLGHNPQILQLPEQLNLAYDCTTHDYYSYCSHISLSGSQGQLQPEPAPGQCGCCKPSQPAPHPYPGSLADWRSTQKSLLTQARYVIAPSHDTAQRISGFAPKAKVLAVPHIDLADTPSLPTPAPRPLGQQRPLKIVVIGALSVIKGADILEATALEAAKHGLPIEFHLLGYCYRHLQTQPRARLTVHGQYQDADLPNLLQWLQADLAWFPAQCPETYSFTLSSVLRAGLPVVVPDIGAFGERVAKRPWSWIAPWQQAPQEWARFFAQLHQQHFSDAKAPPLPSNTCPPYADWQYRQHYLDGLQPTESSKAQSQPIPSGQLVDFVLPPSASSQAKNRTLGLLLVLRSHPLLRPIARAIPLDWQRKVKNWLRG